MTTSPRRRLDSVSTALADAMLEGRLDRDVGTALRRRTVEISMMAAAGLVDAGTALALALQVEIAATMMPPLQETAR